VLGSRVGEGPHGPTPGPRPRFIAGGVVAHNDERRIERSIRSLLQQDLPRGTEWSRVWVVASGCTDRTVEIAQSFAEADPRVGLVVQPARRGKASAIGEVLRRAQGESLVLLNSDAAAAPGAVLALLDSAEGKSRPFAVMGRPTVPVPPNREWAGTMRWMWELHHELHLEILRDGRGAHLSDELLLVSLPAFPWIEDGIINDGSYCAAWLRAHSGESWYAPAAEVVVDVPANPRDHLRQRRRITVGNAQVASRLGIHPTTAFRYLLQEPRRTVSAFRRAFAHDGSLGHFGRIARWEVLAHLLALWDRFPPRKDYLLWPRVAAHPPSTLENPVVAGDLNRDPSRAVDRRIQLLLNVAREFETGLPIEELHRLLPEGTETAPELERILAERTDVSRVVAGTAYPSAPELSLEQDRVRRGVQYRTAAENLVRGPLGWLLPLVRCLGITGSAAYGKPEEGDDLDFFVVTRSGAVPWFLVATFVSLRLWWMRRPAPAGPPPCFNYVVDDRRVPKEFDRGHGLLFAREALSAQMLHGDPYYRGLLVRSPWIGLEIPRVYAGRTQDAEDPAPDPAPLLARILSAALYLPLAAYLQLVGLRRNALLRRARQPEAQFRTLSAPDRIVYESRRFEQLRRRYEEPPSIVSSSPTVAAPSKIPTLR